MTVFYVPPGTHALPGNLSFHDGSWETAIRAAFRTFDEELLGREEGFDKRFNINTDGQDGAAGTAG